jgi:hypothetical protein
MEFQLPADKLSYVCLSIGGLTPFFATNVIMSRPTSISANFAVIVLRTCGYFGRVILDRLAARWREERQLNVARSLQRLVCHTRPPTACALTALLPPTRVSPLRRGGISR